MKATPYSNLKVFTHYEQLNAIAKGERVSPVYIRIKPTNLCNQNCSYCHYKSPYLDLDQYSGSDFIPREKMMEIIGDLADMGVKAITFSGGGEPLLYPFIEESMEMLLKNNIEISIITNGSMLSGKKAELLSRAKWVRISLDAATGETYEKIRNLKEGSFLQVCNNIASFAKIKDASCELGINFVIGKDNYKEVYDAGILLKSLGVNHVKYTALMSNNAEEEHRTFKQEVIENIHKIQNEQTDNFRVVNLYEKDFDSSAVFERPYSVCYVKDVKCVIAANSKVYYCQDKAYLSQGEVGDIKDKSFKEMWFSNETIEKCNAFNAMESCKHHCVHDDRNLLLNSFYNLDKNHNNFI